MKILLRNKKLKKWQLADSIKAKAESELQNLLIESPSLVPIDEIRDEVSSFVFAVGEFGLPGSGNTDVLAFNPDGAIVIIECKLASNSDIKRKVIGQILEYAAYLWKMDYEELNDRILKLKNKNLVELVEDAIASELDNEVFRKNIELTLQSGSFILIVVVDEINEELRKTIRYINECSQSQFSFHALEMNRFQSDEVEILVPYLYGVPAKRSTNENKMKKWSADKFFDILNQTVSAEEARIIKDLYDWSLKIADRVWFGHGAEKGSFTFHYMIANKSISVFTFYTNGNLVLNYGWLTGRLDQELIELLHNKITMIPTFKQIPSNNFDKWPTIKITNAFSDAQYIAEFKKIVEWLGSEIK